ncbi:hypothetical protein HON71_04925 [Candidatus Woesearchaeota archaeon]|jgi:nicotinamidase-related amidase|nr:hypothetical protein [Candidatus Woesearchaeota archaeon]MBT5342377.1 hypothetical protein [Candidatus Woesearchaeota archaeon]
MIESIVMGMKEKLLITPSHYLDREFIAKINSAIEKDNATCFGDVFYQGGVGDYISNLTAQGHKKIQIYGVWEDHCVAEVTYHALSQGLSVTIPRDLIKRWQERQNLVSRLESFENTLQRGLNYRNNSSSQNYEFLIN